MDWCWTLYPRCDKIERFIHSYICTRRTRTIDVHMVYVDHWVPSRGRSESAALGVCIKSLYTHTVRVLPIHFGTVSHHNTFVCVKTVSTKRFSACKRYTIWVTIPHVFSRHFEIKNDHFVYLLKTIQASHNKCYSSKQKTFV